MLAKVGPAILQEVPWIVVRDQRLARRQLQNRDAMSRLSDSRFKLMPLQHSLHFSDFSTSIMLCIYIVMSVMGLPPFSNRNVVSGLLSGIRPSKMGKCQDHSLGQRHDSHTNGRVQKAYLKFFLTEATINCQTLGATSSKCFEIAHNAEHFTGCSTDEYCSSSVLATPGQHRDQ